MGQGDIRRVTAWHLHLKVSPEIIRFYLLSLNLHVLSLSIHGGEERGEGGLPDELEQKQKLF